MAMVYPEAVCRCRQMADALIGKVIVHKQVLDEEVLDQPRARLDEKQERLIQPVLEVA